MKKNLFILFIFVGCYNQSMAQFIRNNYVRLCDDCFVNIEAGAFIPTFSGLKNASTGVGYGISFYNYEDLKTDKPLFLRYGLTMNIISVEFDDVERNNYKILGSIMDLSVHYRNRNGYQAFGGVNLESNFTSPDPGSEDAIEFLTYGLFGGFGLIISENIEINFKYNLGLRNISKNPNQKFKKNYFGVSLGYSFF